HTGGNPTRTVISGLPSLKGETMSDKMLYMQKHYDWIRKFLMNEPRGHSVMSGALLTDRCNPKADIGVIYIETGGYLPMCGHDTIGFCTALVEAGFIEIEESNPYQELKVDTPAGLVEVTIEIRDGKAKEVTFKNRSEEHTSELQSRFDLVCRLLLEKKEKIIYYFLILVLLYSFLDILILFSFPTRRSSDLDTIGFCTALVEAGFIEIEESNPYQELKVDTPAGLVEVTIEIRDGKAKEVTFKNVPAFLLKTVEVEVEGIGQVECDIAYGGNFYGLIDARK